MTSRGEAVGLATASGAIRGRTMPARLRFTIDGLMTVVLVGGINLALAAWAVRSGPDDALTRWVFLLVVPVLSVLGSYFIVVPMLKVLGSEASRPDSGARSDLGRPRFSIGGLMLVVVEVAIASAGVAAAVRSDPRGGERGQLANLIGAMALVIGIDTVFLIRRARSGRPPYGPGWSLPAFALGMGLVDACLTLPFVFLIGKDLSQIVWLPLAPFISAFAVLLPLNWIVHQRTQFEMPLVAVASTLLILATSRLVARERLGWACVLALAVADLSALDLGAGMAA